MLLATDRISVSLICRQGPTLATAQSGQPRRKHGERGRPARRGGCVPCADFAPRANGTFVDRAIISLHRPTTLMGGRRVWSPTRRRRMETDMNDFGRRAGGEALQFGPGGLGPVFSELGAVVAATVVLGLAFVMLS